MAIKRSSNKVRKQRRHIQKTWPVEHRTQVEILIDHQVTAMKYVERRYCHD